MSEEPQPRERVYNFIVEFIRTQTYPPTYREIAAGCGLASPNTAYFHVQKLEAEGRVKLDKRRKIVVV